MAFTTPIIMTIIVIVLLLLIIVSTAIYQVCFRKRDFVQHNTEDTIRLTLNGCRTTEQIEYMKHVREHNLIIAWEESQRYKKMVGGGSEETILEYDDRYDDEDEETDLGTGSGINTNYLAPPPHPWMKPKLGMKKSSSSVYSGDSAKSKASSVVQEWESEHGGFSGYFGMKTPLEKVVGEEMWI